MNKSLNKNFSGDGVSVISAMLARVPPNALVGPDQVAVAFGCSYGTVINWARAGEIESVDLGSGKKRNLQIVRGSLLPFLMSRCNLTARLGHRAITQKENRR